MGVPRWWTQRRIGIFVNTSIASVPAWAPIGQDAAWYRAHVDGEVPDVLLHPSPMAESLAHHRDRWAHVEHYDEFLPFLTFDDFDADHWAAFAAEIGAGYLIATARHHDGLCWWDAPGATTTVLDDGPGRNVLTELSTACNRGGLAFGTSYSLLDWCDTRYPSPSYVADVVHPQVLDLVERCGSTMLWGDGHWGGGDSLWRSDELLRAAREQCPDLVVNDRWWASEPDVVTYEFGPPADIVEHPWELRRGLGAGMGYNRIEHTDHLLDPNSVLSLLTEVVAKGGHLLVSVGTDASGRVPEPHAQILRCAGSWIAAHRDLIDRGTPWTRWGDDECRFIMLDGCLHATLVGRGHSNMLPFWPDDGHVNDVVTGDGRSVPFEASNGGLRLFDSDTSSGWGSLPRVFRIGIEPPPPAPIELFPPTPTAPAQLAPLLTDARPGDIVQLGDGTYVGPSRIPDGVTVRGLGPDRTVIDGIESCAVTLGAASRVEHCTIVGGGTRIAWLPKVAARATGAHSSVVGCRVDGHIDVGADDVRIASSELVGVCGAGGDRTSIARSRFSGMFWDCAIDLRDGGGHVVESCEFDNVLTAVRFTRTVGSVVRGNRMASRWWGVHLDDTEGSVVVGNSIGHTMRAVDVDGGTLAEVSGNVVSDSDSGCVVQGGASDSEVSGNRWERCRIGLLRWDGGTVRHHDNAAIDLISDGGSIVIGP